MSGQNIAIGCNLRAPINPWLLQPLLPNESHHDLILLKLILLDDLPKGLWGTLIPYSFLITSSIASKKRVFSFTSLGNTKQLKAA